MEGNLTWRLCLKTSKSSGLTPFWNRLCENCWNILPNVLLKSHDFWSWKNHNRLKYSEKIKVTDYKTGDWLSGSIILFNFQRMQLIRIFVESAMWVFGRVLAYTLPDRQRRRIGAEPDNNELADGRERIANIWYSGNKTWVVSLADGELREIDMWFRLIGWVAAI